MFFNFLLLCFIDYHLPFGFELCQYWLYHPTPFFKSFTSNVYITTSPYLLPLTSSTNLLNLGNLVLSYDSLTPFHVNLAFFP